MKTPAQKALRISVTLPPAEYASLQRLAEAEERSMDWLGAKAIKSYLQSQAGRLPEVSGGQSAIDFALTKDLR